jgi:hypothetical protein
VPVLLGLLVVNAAAPPRDGAHGPVRDTDRRTEGEDRAGVVADDRAGRAV